MSHQLAQMSSRQILEHYNALTYPLHQSILLQIMTSNLLSVCTGKSIYEDISGSSWNIIHFNIPLPISRARLSIFSYCVRIKPWMSMDYM
ncbi:hypothetical protein GH098_23650 [Escherichia coli]|uniref:Uncharacterized protein n=3 Tax=Escherichia coli TaxID=562 RepID=A0A329ZTV2_ECOLX|nr:hypothetical protein UTI89_C4935 [Escherichia coli UTI89]AQV57565.1 hypothetical protein BE941_14515 [Escherichia coli]AQX99640.1 hypothetical protein B0908_24870 [Escherichia coli NU14]EFJ63395.1 hypothetical protein HMPREF9553_00484 [Escherichia coli MS 200-1]EFN6729522.1 hypothetical protein [Escherichia coli O6:H31]EFN6854133.1 hypothetical protein [Escherichia coli O6]EFN6866761.1 hypothetical protein [Escherichia coli O4:H5]EFN7251889.1 hypothetical protein [Escherichia coli O2:H14]